MTNKVYLGNLSEDIRDRDVEKFLKGYGKIRNVVVKVTSTGGTYGFCEFEDKRDAEDAVKDLDGKTYMGSRVRVEHARDSRGGGGWGGGGRSPPRGRGNPPGRRTGYKINVENLSSRTSWQDLKDYMRQAGEITYTNTHHVRSGEGVVEFGSRSDMEYALDKLDGSELDGKRIKLIPEDQRGSLRSRSRSRSARRSRSKDRRSRSKDRRSRSGRRSRSRGRRDSGRDSRGDRSPRNKSRSKSRDRSRSRSRSARKSRSRS